MQVYFIEWSAPKSCRVCDEKGTERKVSLSIVASAELTGVSSWQELSELERSGAKAFAIKALARQALHSCEMRQKLLRHHVEENIIRETIALCVDRGWIDDVQWVRSRVSFWRRSGKSSRDIKHRLKLKGIDVELDEGLDREALEVLIAKKYPCLLDAQVSRADRDKALRALFRRGYSFSVVSDFICM